MKASGSRLADDGWRKAATAARGRPAADHPLELPWL
jgi:hypothetical protein